MRFSLISLLALGTLSQAFNQGAINAFNRVHPRRYDERRAAVPEQPAFEKRSKSKFLNKNSEKFVVNGTAIPEVKFDVGESYAGLLPISQDPKEERKLYFWFFPSTNPKAKRDEVVIWLNGGPGCSSLSGLLTENGPFLWQEGTLAPVPNSYSWTNLTNVIWIEQPVGVGYSQGKPNITNEVELGKQFIGFWKNFINTFELKGATTYITGESYAGYYVPYIADAFITANDDDYYKLGGVAINDPIIGDRTLQQQAVIYPYIESWANLFYLNQTYMNALRWTHQHCGYEKYLKKYGTFPPPAEKFPVLPDPNADTNPKSNYTCDIFDWAYSAAVDSNPCFNIYHITDTCPHLYSQLGIVNQGDYSPPGAQIYFNRTDVKKALNAPTDVTWYQCTPNNVFGFGNPKSSRSDTSLAPAQNDVLKRVIEHTNNTIIGVGRLDFLLPPNGTLFALQNATWNGKKGFQKYPQDKQFYVPFHIDYNGGRLSEEGTVGQWGEERGLTWYEVQLAGHELPGYAAGSGYRVLEKLLGRIKNLGTIENFTTQKGNFQGNPHERDFTVGTYQQYKADTDLVAAWLASTAKACGYPAHLLTSTAVQSSQPKGGGRLKGKARKDAKKQKPAPSRGPVEATRPKYIIAIKDFFPLDYFIGVLESVRSVLRPRMPADTPSYDSIEDLTNRFSGLNVYEPSEEFLDAPDIVRPQKAQDDENTYEAEPQNTLEDAMIAYAIMLDDLTHIRSHIKALWEN
ncbi:SERINE-TYPE CARBOXYPEPTIDASE F PRECURSOR [Fusarium circinatum]|uniref:Carboxypeptidase n=1 Tax=Fusarium circinatum TaxID=48490 RepID=A0A8H5T2Z3_FUSCI|nr:SERINE-TYPE CARBOXYPEPTIDASE F PRECURSOR [Fusarium circinatum]